MRTKQSAWNMIVSPILCTKARRGWTNTNVRGLRSRVILPNTYNIPIEHSGGRRVLFIRRDVQLSLYLVLCDCNTCIHTVGDFAIGNQLIRKCTYSESSSDRPHNRNNTDNTCVLNVGRFVVNPCSGTHWYGKSSYGRTEVVFDRDTHVYSFF